MTAPDVVIVGAGVIGAACAYELALAGRRVTVIDRGEPGGEASGASAGILSGLTDERADPLSSLLRLSRSLYGPLAEALRADSGMDIQHGQPGHIQLCVGEAEVRWAQKTAAEHGDRSEPVEFLTPDDLVRLEPQVTREAGGGLFMPRGGWVNSERLVAALVRAATRRGVRFLLGQPVEEIVQANGRVTGVRARGVGTVTAGAVVLAAGAWSSQIAGAPRALQVRPVRGQMLALDNAPPVIQHVIFRDEAYLVPRLDGECHVGATVEDEVGDKTVTPAALHWLLTEALTMVSALARAPFRRAWAGVRPATPDGLPAIGPWPDLPRLFVATGHFRSGIVLAPLTARLIREWVVDGRGSVAADPLLPHRLLR